MRCCALGLLLVLVIFGLHSVKAGEASKEFARSWQEAGLDEGRKRDLLDRLAKEASGEAAKLLVAVALMPGESGSITEHAIARLADLEGSDGDAWMQEQMRHDPRWADRAILARAIGRRSSEGGRNLLLAGLEDKAWQVQSAAIEGLRRHRTPDVVERLIDFWSKLDPKRDDAARLGGDARDTLLVITGKDFLAAPDARSWWTVNGKAWKPEKRPEDAIRSTEAITEERVPRLFDEIASRRVVFVLDTSASMLIPTGAGKDAKRPQGLTRFEVMRSEVRRVIEELPPGAAFNLVAFSGKILPWREKLVVASEGNKRAANRFVDLLKADGETNSYGALEQAFRAQDADTVYFLSDGYPTVGKIDFNVILADVKKWNATRNLKVHTIAFVAGNGKPLGIEEGDKQLPKEFMRRLAQENGGRYRVVE